MQQPKKAISTEHPAMLTTAISVSTSPFLHALLLCLLCSVRTIFAFNQEHAITNHFDTVDVSSLLPSSTCTSTSKDSDENGFLSVTHTHGPCTRLKHGKAKAPPTIADIFQQDLLRARFLHAKLFNQNSTVYKSLTESKAVKVPAKAATPDVGRINYLATFSIGTPPQQIALELDTGSNLVWTQCTQCRAEQCFKQRDPLFDPSKSSTYGAVSCPSSICSASTNTAGFPSICTSSKCQYLTQYGDGSYSHGFMSTEKLTLTPSDVFYNFKFGCGTNNTSPVVSDGVVGLGRDPLSIVQQLKHKYGEGFSYCFPSKFSEVGFFKFGATVASKHLKYTPLNNDRVGKLVYSVTMTAIVLGGKTLPISAQTLKSPTILDSGTVYSFIEPKAYRILRGAFREEMSDYPRVNPDSVYVKGILDTCYSLGNHKAFRIPKMSVVFAGGSTVNLATSGVVVPVNSTVVCLAYTPNTLFGTSLTILGNTLQHTLEVVYDIGNGRVGFGEGACP